MADTKPLAIKEPSTAEVSFKAKEKPAVQEKQPKMDDESTNSCGRGSIRRTFLSHLYGGGTF
jgi:hypothetical protein